MNNKNLDTFEKMKGNTRMMRTSGKKLLEIVQTNEQELFFPILFASFFFPSEMEKEELLDTGTTWM